MLGDASKNPALRGDVALIVYDAAVEALPATEHKLSLSRDALSLFDKFEDLDRQHLCDHVVGFLLAQSPTNVEAQLLYITQPIRYTAHDDATFPDLLKLVLLRYSNTNPKTPELKSAVRDHFNDKYMTPELVPPLDANLRLVLKAFMKKL
jgi:U3 small nucleolar RNA-associated protein 6